MNRLDFFIEKSFGTLELFPTESGLNFQYYPEGSDDPTEPQYDFYLGFDYLGDLLVATRAYFHGYSVPEISVKIGSFLFKFYKSNSDDTVWLRLISGTEDSERVRLKMTAVDLLAFEAALQTAISLYKPVEVEQNRVSRVLSFIA